MMNPQFGMGMGFGMPQMPMQTQFMMGMSPNENEEWLKGFQMGVQEVNSMANSEENQPGPKLNIVFNTTQGTLHNLVLPYGTTISQAIEKYLNRVGRPDLFGKPDQLCFLVNAQKLQFNDQTPIEQYFKNNLNPKIVVNDTNNLIGA